jgi:hypothetical protein
MRGFYCFNNVRYCEEERRSNPELANKILLSPTTGYPLSIQIQMALPPAGRFNFYHLYFFTGEKISQ